MNVYFINKLKYYKMNKFYLPDFIRIMENRGNYLHYLKSVGIDLESTDVPLLFPISRWMVRVSSLPYHLYIYVPPAYYALKVRF